MSSLSKGTNHSSAANRSRKLEQKINKIIIRFYISFPKTFATPAFCIALYFPLSRHTNIAMLAPSINPMTRNPYPRIGMTFNSYSKRFVTRLPFCLPLISIKMLLMQEYPNIATQMTMHIILNRMT